MVCRLIDFALVVLKLWMFKVRGIIVISKIEFFKFSGTERVKENKDLVLRVIATLKRSLVSLSNIFKKCFDFLFTSKFDEIFFAQRRSSPLTVFHL